MSREKKEWREDPPNSSKHLLRVGNAEATLVRSGYRSTESGEEDHIIGVFVKDVLQSFLKLCHCGGSLRQKVLIEDTMGVYMIR